MPHSRIMARASWVTCWMSLAAPEETSFMAFASAMRPPQMMRMVAWIHLREYPMRSFSGREKVAPPEAPRGMMVTLWRGSASFMSAWRTAWPASWYATSSFSSFSRTRERLARPNLTLSRASSRSSCSMKSLLCMVAPMAASLMMAARSAPENMGVPRASFLRSTFGPSFTFDVWTWRISRRPLTSGRGTSIWRSKRPGRMRAGSRTSGRFVAAMTMTPSPDSKPSISTRIALSVCSRSS